MLRTAPVRRDRVAISRSPFESLRTNGNHFKYDKTTPFVVRLSNHERNRDTVSKAAGA